VLQLCIGAPIKQRHGMCSMRCVRNSGEQLYGCQNHMQVCRNGKAAKHMPLPDMPLPAEHMPLPDMPLLDMPALLGFLLVR